VFCSQGLKNELEWKLVGYFFKRTVMKKSIIALVAAAAFASGANAQEETGNTAASGSTIGGIATQTVVLGAVAAGVAAGVIANNNSDDPTEGPGPDPEPSCEGTDPLVDGVCVGTTSTVTVTGTGTATTTVTVPVTFTYAPTL
jgi:hypothetical protein